ncbi:MAG: hypothetical protein ACOVNY_01875 [Chitinophagaceae bacterium]
MKKVAISSLVGGVIIFLWQLLSYNLLHLHRDTQKYSPNQDSILKMLTENLSEEGQYLLPTLPAISTPKEQQRLADAQEGRSWAVVSFHKNYTGDIIGKIIIALLTNIVMVGMLAWIFSKMEGWGLFTFFVSSVFVGLIVFMNTSVTNRIWNESFGLTADLIDAVASWGLVGLWMGGYLGVKPKK